MEIAYRCKGDPRTRAPNFEGRTFTYPKPIETLKAALAKLEPDGSVIVLDDETNELFAWGSYEPVPVDKLDQDIWCRKVISVANQIEELCWYMGPSSHPEARPDEVRQMEIRLEGTAHYLSAYRHAPDFLEKAASLVNISETGMFHHPQLPGGGWAFAPKNIAFRHQPSSGILLPSSRDQATSE